MISEEKLKYFKRLFGFIAVGNLASVTVFFLVEDKAAAMMIFGAFTFVLSKIYFE